jgi:uncharacterized BrkB/YihY/UPF0761 family membrane protein
MKVRIVERATPIAAVLAALTTLACCLPLNIAGAAGLAALAAWAGPYRVWFLLVAALLLVAGFFQIYRRAERCEKRSRLSVALFWISAIIAVLIVFFPQLIANLMAGSG